MRARYLNERGVALVVALVMSLAIMAMVTGVLYFVTQSTTMSGAGKRFATADDAADGAVNVIKDTINLALWGEPLAGVFPTTAGDCAAGTGSATQMVAAILTDGGSCGTTINLPDALGGFYTANVTLERLYSLELPGGRLEFARSAGGVASTAVYYRITVRVDGPANTSAENSALYRFAG
jgi:hypothetical protein